MALLRPHAAAVALACLPLCACDLAFIPTLAEDVGKPAVMASVDVDVTGMPPALEAMEVEVVSIAIRRERDQVWLPMLASDETVTLVPDAPLAGLTAIPMGADTYDRIEIIVEEVRVAHSGQWHAVELDDDAAILAVQWALDRDVNVVFELDFREDVTMSAQEASMTFAPLVRLE